MPLHVVLMHKLVCGLVSDLEGSDNVVFCRGYGDVRQRVVGNGHCCSYLWVRLAQVG